LIVCLFVRLFCFFFFSFPGELSELCALMPTLNLMEFGAGDGHKTQTLIDHFVSLDFDLTYFPIDISEGALESLLKNVKAPKICPIAGFTRKRFCFVLLNNTKKTANNLVGCAYVVSQTTSPTLALFLGSSIGNYDLPGVLFVLLFFNLVTNKRTNKQKMRFRFFLVFESSCVWETCC
jgi:uncharacterized SAM-dependent methyltransferase